MQMTCRPDSSLECCAFCVLKQSMSRCWNIFHGSGFVAEQLFAGIVHNFKRAGLVIEDDREALKFLEVITVKVHHGEGIGGNDVEGLCEFRI